MHVQARKAPEVIPGELRVGPAEAGRLIELLAEGKTIEAATAHMNKDWRYGVLNGPSAPLVASDGTVIDPDKQRPYSLSEVAALSALPEIVEGVKALQEELAKLAAEERRAAKAAQLALARTIKQVKAEQERCPLLYAEVVRLSALVAWLADRSFDQVPFDTASLLPAMKDEDHGTLKN